MAPILFQIMSEKLSLDVVIYVEVDRKDSSIQSRQNKFNVPSEQQTAFLRLDNWTFPVPYSTAAPSLILFLNSCRSCIISLSIDFSVSPFFLAVCTFPLLLLCREDVRARLSLHNPFLFLVLLSLCLFPSNSSFTVSLEPRQGVRGDR